MNPIDDNVMPNPSVNWFDVPEEQSLEREEEERKLSQAKPLIQEVVQHIEEQILRLNTLDSIEADLSTDPVLYQKMVEVNRMVRDILLVERNYIVERVVSYL